MKVLFNYHFPFMLTHGGTQVQIEQTQAALEKLGISVEPLRWWDESQQGDILHHFTRIPTNLVQAAQRKGMKVVFSELLTETGSRSLLRLKVQKLGTHLMARLSPGLMAGAFRWGSFQQADACFALTDWEAYLIRDLFRAPPERLHVVPNGVEEVFLKSARRSRGQWLVCTATITERKRVLELAKAAVQARTPVWIIGRPYSQADPYGCQFQAFARAHPDLVRYEGPIQDRARLAEIYREARGFVLLSTMESLSLSALEAAACECPLLLSDLPWATWTFKDQASYCPADRPAARTARVLRDFYDRAPQLPMPAKPLSWLEVGQQLKAIYEKLLRTS